ncbi:thioesterase domain-containing protein [Microbispora sp. NPDC046933]|uniref:thioesterase II family protein n=1 Tax=Microbispora sp. NPDC046933 TaxID=3155618 RepID=UPI0033D527B5
MVNAWVSREDRGARPGAGRLGPWLRCWSPRPAARLHLVCLPHAGGGAGSYRPWAALLPPQVELLVVQYPGREDRFDDPMVDDMADLVAGIADDLRPVLDRPYALFGHSMGSAVGWELALELRRRGAPEPRRLFASGRAAPGTAPTGEVHRQPDEALRRELERLGGTTGEVLADPGLRAVVLACVRGDYRLIETYRPGRHAPLHCPIDVFTGDADPELPLETVNERAGGWADLTTAGTETHVFPGDHFYLNRRRREVVASVLRRLDPSLAPNGQTWPSTP